jgi:transcriptional regulator with XRE-family HTH domain
MKTMMSAEEIGHCISRMRKLQRVTQREIAEKLDTHQSVVARWEKGQMYPREEIVERIASILGVSTEELLTGHNKVSSTVGNPIEPDVGAHSRWPALTGKCSFRMAS